ncbi:MAG: SMP-30/gluconolactonase/LRE family protein, partial [Myxococcota bacterium]
MDLLEDPVQHLDFETLASGYALVEGPTWAPDGSLFWSDVLGGGVYRRTPDGGVSTAVPKRRGVGGIALHADGGLVLGGRDLIHVKDGVTRALLQLEGLPGWNDLCADARGRVWAGSVRFRVFDPEATPLPGECWRVDAPGVATPVYAGVLHANGIALSPDERWLAHSDTRSQGLWVHDLDAEGRVSRRRRFAVEGAPDGLAFDAEGCVWVAIYGGGRIDRFTPAGKLDRSLDVPARQVTSLCFAGSDLRELVVVTADNARDPSLRGCVLRARLDV